MKLLMNNGIRSSKLEFKYVKMVTERCAFKIYRYYHIDVWQRPCVE
jgi:hypothetical protein